MLLLFSILYILIVFFQQDMRIRWIGPAIPPLVILSAYGLKNIFKYLTPAKNLASNSIQTWLSIIQKLISGSIGSLTLVKKKEFKVFLISTQKNCFQKVSTGCINWCDINRIYQAGLFEKILFYSICLVVRTHSQKNNSCVRKVIAKAKFTFLEITTFFTNNKNNPKISVNPGTTTTNQI